MEKMTKTMKISENAKIAGVVAGMAEYFNLNVKVARVLYALLTIGTGFAPGIILYVLIMFSMVNSDDKSNAAAAL